MLNAAGGWRCWACASMGNLAPATSLVGELHDANDDESFAQDAAGAGIVV